MPRAQFYNRSKIPLLIQKRVAFVININTKFLIPRAPIWPIELRRTARQAKLPGAISGDRAFAHVITDLHQRSGLNDRPLIVANAAARLVITAAYMWCDSAITINGVSQDTRIREKEIVYCILIIINIRGFIIIILFFTFGLPLKIYFYFYLHLLQIT